MYIISYVISHQIIQSFSELIAQVHVHTVVEGNVAVRQMRDSPEYRDSPAPYS